MGDSQKRNNRWIAFIVCYCAVMLAVLIGLRIWDYNRTVSAPLIENTEVPPPAAVLLVNINTASIDELTELPGIGDGLGQKIIEYREKNGEFAHIEDIMKVEGIGQKTFEKLSALITV